MAISKFFSISYRNLARNGRRTVLTALAVALGLVVVMAMASLIDGMLASMLADNIRLSTGHMQIRNAAYDESKGSILAKDLLRDGDLWATQAKALPEVKSAAPELWFGGLLITPKESTGIEMIGIDTENSFYDPIRTGIIEGAYLNNDDRGRILVGRGLAKEMDITIDQRVSLAASDASGQGQEGVFTVAGLVDTGFPSIDQHRIIMPLAQAQSFSGVGNRFSSLILLLHNQDDAAALTPMFTGPDTKVLTWVDLNSLLLQSMETGIIFYYILYGIVFLAIAVLIANTLLMSVFARAREIGILGSLGMNRRQIILLFLIEGILLALLGIAFGLVLGLGLVAYLKYVGISIPSETASMVEGFAFGTKLYGDFAFDQFAILSFMLLIVVSLVSLYPAWYAARLEPVEALHSL